MNYINPSELKEFVENNPKLVTRRQSTRFPDLFVLKYAKRVFYDNLWNLNPLLNECRGLVVDKDYNVVVKPFTKVFNYGENDTRFDRDEVCTIVRKVDGFMACATFNPKVSDEVIISTTGSLDSKFVDLASTWIKPMEEQIKMSSAVGETMIFEICDHTDQHIIEEAYGAYLIGMFDPSKPQWVSEKELDFVAEDIGAKRPEWDEGVLFDEVVEISKFVKHEGFMVYNRSGDCLKIKSPNYLTTKFFSRMNGDKVLKLLEDPYKAKKTVDEEFYELVDYLHKHREEFVKMNELEKVSLIRNFLGE